MVEYGPGGARPSARGSRSRCSPSWRSAAPRSARCAAVSAVTGLPLARRADGVERRRGSHRRSAASSTRPRSPAWSLGQRSSASESEDATTRYWRDVVQPLRSTATCRRCSTSTPTSCATGSGTSTSATTTAASRRRRTSRAPSPRRSKCGPRRSASTCLARRQRAGRQARSNTACAPASPSPSATRRSTRAARPGWSRCRRRSTRRSGRSCSRPPRSARRASTSTCGATPSSTGTCPPTRSTSSSARAASTATRATPCAATSRRHSDRTLFADGLPDAASTRGTSCSSARPRTRQDGDGEMVPYWVFHQGPAQDRAPRPGAAVQQGGGRSCRDLRKTLAAYRLAFGQPRQEELIEFLGADRSESDLFDLA